MREEHDASSGCTALEEPLFHVTRREFVGGVATSVFIATQASADDSAPFPDPVRAIRDPNDPSRFGVEVQLPPEAVGTSVAPPRWQFFADELGGGVGALGRPQMRPVDMLNATGFRFAAASLFADSRIALQCDFIHDPISKSWAMAGILDGKVGGKDLKATGSVALSDFLAGTQPLSFAIADAGVTDELARAWFGRRIQFDDGAGCTILLCRDDPPQAKDPAQAAKNPVPKGRPTRLEVTPGRGALNAFDGSVRFPKLVLSRVGNRDGEGAAIQTDDKRADRGWTLLGVADGPTWTQKSYTLGGGGITIIPDRQKDTDSGPSTLPPRSVFFRRMRDQLETLAGLRASLTARFTSDEAGVPCEFELADALLLRRSLHNPPSKAGEVRTYDPASLDESRRTQVTLRGALSTRHQAVETVYGAFEIAGDSSLDSATEAVAGGSMSAKTNPLDAAKDPQRGLTHLIAEDQDDNLTSLDVRGLLTHMSVSVGEEEPADPQKGRSGWSRLDFEGTEIALGLPDDMARARAAGASGVVTLGEAARQFPEPAFAPPERQPLPPRVRQPLPLPPRLRLPLPRQRLPSPLPLKGRG